MFSAKKREFLDRIISKAGLNKVSSKAWTRDDEKKAIALVHQALLQGSGCIYSMMYTLLRGEILGAIEGSSAYEFGGNLPSLLFVEAAIDARSAKERCELLTFMLELLKERVDKSVSFLRQRDLIQSFLYAKVRTAFPQGSEGYCTANMLDDSMRNWEAGEGEYPNPHSMLMVSKALEKLAEGV